MPALGRLTSGTVQTLALMVRCLYSLNIFSSLSLYCILVPFFFILVLPIKIRQPSFGNNTYICIYTEGRLMKSIPTLFEFEKCYQSENDCWRALEKMKWPGGFVCPKCGHDDGYRLSRRHIIQCAVCRHQTSVTAGTIFDKTRIPLLNWFWMIFLLPKTNEVFLPCGLRSN